MLFNYQYINHSIEQLQVYLDHLVKEVWCKPTGNYSVNLLHPELKDIVNEIKKDKSIKTDYLAGPIKRIYNIFKTKLDANQRLAVSAWYDNNNDIESLCANIPNKEPGTYEQIKLIDIDLAKELKKFYGSLYMDIIDLKAITNRTGELSDHYKSFGRVNKKEKCPYCGYNDVKGVNHSKREAYDHYLPKGIYPFNSINFKNLAPMCHECNTTYKQMKDPIRYSNATGQGANSVRRKAFYSYSTNPANIKVELILNSIDIYNLCPSDIDLQITAPGREEELESWKEIFGIEERYKAKFCSESDGKSWYLLLFEEYENIGMTPEKILQMIVQNAKSHPWTDCNFLRSAFLQACHTTINT